MGRLKQILIYRQRFNQKISLLNLMLIQNFNSQFSYSFLIQLNSMQDYYQRSREYGSPYEDVLNNGRRSYNFSNMQKSIQLSQTDKRIQQIKRKYDTPNRKDRISQLSAKKYDLSNKENQNYGTADFKTKIPSIPIQTQGSEQGMKESKAISNSRQTFFNNPSSTSKNYMPSQIPRQRDSYDPKLTSNKLYTTENEEQFFKRVKEMKQSLLYGDNSTKQPEMRSSTFYPIRQSRARSGFYDSNQTIEKDRIDNIDKINQKIKGILQCLNENQKTRIPSRADNNKRSKADILGNNDQEINVRDIAKTPVKNVITSSIMGRESFGPQRHQRSQILDKIEINRQFREQNRKIETKKTQDDDKWQKLSSKLEKYELQNKLRYQKAYDFSKEIEKEVPTNTQSIVDNIRKQRTSYQEPIDIKKSTELPRRDNRSIDVRDVRSRSFLNPQTSIKETRDRSLYSRDLTGQKDYQMKSGKKLDDEIGRLQKKIQQFEEQKKRLGVNFKPFSYSNTKSTSNLFMNNTRTELPKNDYSERKISDFKGASIRNQSSLNPKPKQNLNQQFTKLENQETFREKKEYRELQSFHDNSFNRLDSKIEIKIEKSNPSSVRTSKFISHESSRVSDEKEEQQESFRLDQESKPTQQQQKPYERSYKYMMDENLKKHTDEGIEQRRRKLMGMENEESRCQNGELKSLVKSLCDQVQLDEDFRNAKIWFQCMTDPKKEDEVKRLLPNKSLQQIREIFYVRESQNNPFFTTQGYDSSYATLVELFKKSESHWNQNIYKKYNKGSLESQGFTSKDIDLEKKGHINLGDLVRFLNLESGTFYRNRDLSLVFIRIAKQYKGQSHTQVSFSQMMETFCR